MVKSIGMGARLNIQNGRSLRGLDVISPLSTISNIQT
jgi:hypothetical protein